MLRPPNEPVKRALARLRVGDKDFAVVLEYLGSELEHLDTQNRRTVDPVLLRQQQGAAHLLATFIGAAQGKPHLASVRPTEHRASGSAG